MHCTAAGCWMGSSAAPARLQGWLLVRLGRTRNAGTGSGLNIPLVVVWPVQGVELAMAAARAAYAQQGAADKLQLYVVPGCAHECTPCMWDQASWLLGRSCVRGALCALPVLRYCGALALAWRLRRRSVPALPGMRRCCRCMHSSTATCSAHADIEPRLTCCDASWAAAAAATS